MLIVKIYQLKPNIVYIVFEIQQNQHPNVFEIHKLPYWLKIPGPDKKKRCFP